MVSFIKIAFVVVKLKFFKVLGTDSASMKWSFLGVFWALAATNMVPKTFGLKFRCFSCCHIYILKKKELDYLMQNLMLNRLAPISNPKNEKAISSHALL